MKKILDLRFIIGMFFLLVGILLFITSLVVHHPAGDKTETVNRWCGIVYIIFSVIMLALWKFGGKRPPVDLEE